MDILDKEAKLHQHYEKIGLIKDDRLTAFDYNLRNLEIEYAKQYLSDNKRVLDVGAGPGVACFEYAKLSNQVKGIDYAQSMVDFSMDVLHQKHPDLIAKLSFAVGSVLDLPYAENAFDVITSHRVLIALLSWEKQQQALREIIRCLDNNGLYIMFEAVEEGLISLNKFRNLFNLPEIAEGGCGDYERLLFSEKKLMEFMKDDCELIAVHGFGMYYFISRIIQPLFAAPELPKYDHKLNDIAFEIAKKIPDFENIGHLKGYVWKKRG